jgi:uncharacterized protein
MTQRARLIFFGLALMALLTTGWAITGSFDFVLSQFWFASGFFLLILLSLIDQPHYSTDANVLANGIAAGVSLLLVPNADRSLVWWAFLGWSAWLIATSYVLILRRTKRLAGESPLFQGVSRLNREIGRPSAIFSAFLLWGAVIQFGPASTGTAALFTFWAVFTILNIPSLSQVLGQLLDPRRPSKPESIGHLVRVISPRVAEIQMFAGVTTELVGRKMALGIGDEIRATGVLIDDRVLAGSRIGRLALTNTTRSWAEVGDVDPADMGVQVFADTAEVVDPPISVVDVGSEIGKLVFQAHPDIALQSGELVWVASAQESRAFYQVVSAAVTDRAADDKNAIQSVRVTAGELGSWEKATSRFGSINWVPPAGGLVHRVTTSVTLEELGQGRHSVGVIPNSTFPIHVGIADVVTHNTAIIGVTGSGKSFLAFDLIEGMVKAGIKVLILDVSRQHDLYLRDLGPKALVTAADVPAWFASGDMIGIHQFAAAPRGYPYATAEFAEAALGEVSKTKLERGKNVSAQLCVVFEEAHSLLPEWNQVADRDDTSHVNRAARAILQGRKFGMGALVISQRTANVTKTVLNQCNSIFALQSFDQTGLDFLRNYMGDQYSQAISTLPLRHAILVGMASSSTRPVLLQVQDMSKRWQEDAVSVPPEAGLAMPPPTSRASAASDTPSPSVNDGQGLEPK